MGLRDEQRALTRRMILEALLDLVAEGEFDGLSVPAVAERSGVSAATIYRYFPTKDDLLSAAAEEPARAARAGAPPPDDGDDQLAANLHTMWRSLADRMPLLRHQVASAAGREMRASRLDRSRRQLDGHVRQFGVDPGSAEGERLVSLLLLLNGSLALVELHDRQGMGIDQSVEVARWASQVLIEATAAGAATTPGAHLIGPDHNSRGADHGN